jgi:hypothetical protein
MGVSSATSVEKRRRISSCASGLALGYAAAKRAHAEVRAVNQSPVDRRRRRGTKCSSICWGERSLEMLEMDSAALSRTNVSSTAARFSRGPRIVHAYCLPPTYSVKLPSSSASTSSTSSSSSSWSWVSARGSDLI